MLLNNYNIIKHQIYHSLIIYHSVVPLLDYKAHAARKLDTVRSRGHVAETDALSRKEIPVAI